MLMTQLKNSVKKKNKFPIQILLRVNLRLSSLNFYFDLLLMAVIFILLMTEIFIHIIILQYSLTQDHF